MHRVAFWLILGSTTVWAGEAGLPGEGGWPIRYKELPKDEKVLRRTARAVKAMMDQGHRLSPIIATFPSVMESVPRKYCIQVVTARTPNAECPDNPEVGPSFDDGSIACENSETGRIDYVGYFVSSCGFRRFVPSPTHHFR